MKAARGKMKPGQVFVFRCQNERAWESLDQLLVVIDGKTEVGFWTGSQWRCGEICPASHFEVVA